MIKKITIEGIEMIQPSYLYEWILEQLIEGQFSNVEEEVILESFQMTLFH